MAYKLKPNTKTRQLQRGILVAAGISVMALAGYFAVILSQSDVEESKAINLELLADDPINNGEIILGFDWDAGLPTQAVIGPTGISVNRDAICLAGGTENSLGLGLRAGQEDLSLEISEVHELSADGLDISVDHRYSTARGGFFSRGKNFNFGLDDGYLTIRCKFTATNGKSYVVDERTSYKIPEDELLRNYRFYFNPSSGRAEILVNRATVWSHQAPPQSRLSWSSKENIIIGSGMGSGKHGKAVFDNLIIRKTGTSKNSPIDLLSFSAEVKGQAIELSWHTSRETETEYFKIERSTDTKNFMEIGKVAAAGNSTSLQEYRLLDEKPVIGIAYYRLALSNTLTRSVWVPVIAFRLKPEMLPGQSPPGITENK